MGPDAMILVFWMLSFKPTFSLSFHFHQEALWFFAFCYKGGIICISEVIDIFPGNLDFSLCFIQPSVSHVVVLEIREVRLDGLEMFGKPSKHPNKMIPSLWGHTEFYQLAKVEESQVISSWARKHAGNGLKHMCQDGSTSHYALDKHIFCILAEFSSETPRGRLLSLNV